MVDGFGRQVSYLRISVTDRCDLRCTYCMAETMQFLPRREILNYEEIDTLARAFVARGVDKIRLTGGEPLARRGIGELFSRLGRLVGPDGLRELTLTTNGTQLARHARMLKDAGVRRINVSLDSRDPARFAAITRRDVLDKVLGGIEAAQTEGLAVKINMVAMRGINDDEIADMLVWTHASGMALTLIEGMPLGEVALDRADTHIPLAEIRERLTERFTLEPLSVVTGGPARYWRVAETGGQIGFISPLSHNFCATCNRVRLTARGELFLCLGREDRADLRAILREQGAEGVAAVLDQVIARKPERHQFDPKAAGGPALARHMSATGG